MGYIGAAWEVAADNTNSYLALSTRGSGNVSERLRINSSGNIGVGTASPSSKFDINGGSVTIRGSNAGLVVASGNVGIGSTNPTSALDVSGTVTATAFSGNGSGLTNVNASGFSGTLTVSQGGTGATSLSSGYLVKGNGTAAASASVIYDDGSNIGIGTASPSSKFDIVGGSLTLRGSNAGLVVASGNVGIGATNPAAPAEVRSPDAASASGQEVLRLSAAYSAGTQGSGAILNFNDATSGTIAGQIRSAAEGASKVGLGFYVYNSGLNEALHLNNTGKIGIGTNNASSLLDVAGGSLTVRGTNNGIIVTSGNVGIGSTNPVAPLDVSGSVNLQSDVTFPGPGIWKSTGKVGVGTNNPSSSLDVYGGSITVRSGPSGSPALAIGDSAFYVTISGNVGAGTAVPSSRLDVSGGSVTIRGANNGLIVTSGNVGIGTTNPTDKLALKNGNFYALDGGILVSSVTLSGLSADPGAATGSLAYRSDTGALRFNGPAGWVTVSTQVVAPGSSQWTTAGSNIYYNTGNVGVGNSNPSSAFDVNNGSISVRGAGAGLAIGSTNFIVAGNGWTGIGTTAPLTKLDVNFAEGSYSTRFFRVGGGASWPVGSVAEVRLDNNGYQPMFYLTNADGRAAGYGAGMIFQSSADSTNMISAAQIGFYTEQGWTGTAATQDASLFFQTALDGSLSEKMRITSGGNVGIGTNSVSSKLDVFGGSVTIRGTNAGLIVASGNVGIGTSAPTATLEIASGGSSSPLRLTPGTGAVGDTGYMFVNNRARFGYNGTLQAVYIDDNAASKPIVFATGSGPTERVRIDTAGNVGIGTSSPAQRLELKNGNFSALDGGILVSSVTLSGLSADPGAGTGSLAYRSDTGALRFNGPAGWVTVSTQIVAPGSSQWTTAGSNIYYNSGNVSIGTISSSSKLEVTGGSITIRGAGAGLRVGTTNFFVGPGGGTAIGTAIPGNYSLHVTGSGWEVGARIENSAGNPALEVDRNSGAGPIASFTLGNTQVLGIYGSGNVGIGNVSPSSTLDVFGGSVTIRGTNAGLIVNSGNVGLGTQSPTKPLHLNVNDIQFLLQNPGAGGGSWYLGSSATGWVSGAGKFIITNADDSSASSLVIDSAKDVGIGTTDPSSKMDVFGGSVTIRGTNAGLIVASGNVGIGTTNPISALDVGAPTGYVWTRSTTATNWTGYVASNNGGAMYIARERSTAGAVATGSLPYAGVIEVDGAYPLHLATNGAVHATVDSGGDFGIGTASPSSLLDVFGGSVTVRGSGAGLIVASGNVGIGTTNPTSPLVVNGSIVVSGCTGCGSGTSQWTTSGSNIYYNTGNVSVGTTGSSSKFELVGGSLTIRGTSAGLAVGSTNFFVNQGGVVSIGTPGPAGAGLVVYSDQGISNTQHYVGSFEKGGAGSGGIYLGYDANGSNVTAGYIRSINSLPMKFGTTGTPYGMTLNDSGNLGIGTDNPSSRLDVFSGSVTVRSGGITINDPSYAGGLQIAVGGNWARPADGSLGYLHFSSLGEAAIVSDCYCTGDANNNDIFIRKSNSASIGGVSTTAAGEGIGRLRFSGVNSSNAFTQLAAVGATQEGASGATYVGGRLEFGTSDNSTGMSFTRMVINSAGNVGVGTASPSSLFDVNGGSITVRGTNAGLAIRGLPTAGSANVSYNSTTGAFSVISSARRFKQNIKPLVDDFRNILKVSPKSFNYKTSPNVPEVGFIAEEVEEAGLKNLVVYNDAGVIESVKYDRIPLYLLEVIKQQEKDIGRLKDETRALREEKADFDRRLRHLEERISKQ